MNSRFKKFKASFTRRNRLNNFVISVVILVEILAILTVATYAWVETVSSIKIAGEGKIDTYVFTDAVIGSGKGTIDLAGYFKQAGDMHLAPASSSDGTTMFFPQVASTTYRKGSSSDKNTSYLSVTFRVKADTNADFYFTKVPTFSNLGSDIRVSVTSQSEGTNDAPVTQLYALSKSTAAVVNTTSGDTGTANVEAFADHIKGKSSTARLFNIGANETKVVTINIWLQKKSTDMNSVMSQAIKITDFGITSSLTPRRVTLVPGSVWNEYNPTFYAWCWEGGANNPDKFYKLTDNGDGSYSFDYNGTYQKLVFIRARNGLTTDAPNWNGDIWNQTVNLSVPASPVDPTYFMTYMGAGYTYGSANDTNQSSGIWEEPATVKVAYVTGQESYGTVSATYDGYTATGDGQEAQVLSRGGKSVTIRATAKDSNYEFVGWYTDEAGTTASSASAAASTVTAPNKGKEITYYAKFKEVRTITLLQYIDGKKASGAGTLHIDDESGTGDTLTKSVDKGTSVTLSADESTGYTLSGIYTTEKGDTKVSTVTADDNSTYYARFTANSYNVTTSAYYLDGSTYKSGNTGGTVQTGDADASSGTTTTSTKSVKYKQSVTLTATPKSGYSFVGWYSSTTAATALSTSASYSYTLDTASDVTVYARFKPVSYYLAGWINKAAVTSAQSSLKFTQSTTNTSEFTLDYTFTGHEQGAQYVTVYDGTNVYHPNDTNAESGTAADTSKTDQNPNGDTKWMVNAPNGTKVRFTWNASSKELSWSLISRTYYLDVSKWTPGNARFSLWVNDDNAFTSMTKVNNSLYKVTITNTTSKIIFCRMNGSTTENNWNNKWDQTDDLVQPSNQNYFVISSSNNGKGYGSWSLY